MALTRGVHETDHPASYDTPSTTGCSELEEFQALSHLVNEFSVLDRSLFPFCLLGDSDLRSEINRFPGRPTSSDRDGRLGPVRGALVYFSSLLNLTLNDKGNYVAGYILRDLRIQSKKNTQIYPDLCFIFDLPPELVFEVRIFTEMPS